MNLHDFSDTLRIARGELLERAKQAMEDATSWAVDVATDNTPPGVGGPWGSGTITGDMYDAWWIDSTVDPEVTNHIIKTTLANNQPYASWVNDGHFLDEHFVPGLYIDSAGLVAKGDYQEVGGLVVGTQTQFVIGYYMKEKAIQAFEEEINKSMQDILRGLFD